MVIVKITFTEKWRLIYMKEAEIEMNRIADDTIEKMQGMSLKDMEKLILKLPDRVAKLILIKIIRKSE